MNTSFGAMIDRSNFVLWGEYGRISSSGGSNGFLKLLFGGYVLAGYRIGDFLPRYQFTYSDWSRSGIPTLTKGTTHGLGLNYQATAHLVLKGDYEVYLNPGTCAIPNGVVAASGFPQRASVATLGIDFIF